MQRKDSKLAETVLSEALERLRFPEGPSLIVDIPPEILEKIFQICAAMPLTRGERPNRLAISQVCQQWRTITLNNPWIWGRIEVGSPKMAKELLSRSEGAFLDIVCAEDTRMIKVRGTDLQPYSNRIQSFDIAFRREYELGNLFSKIGDDFPNLASMSLNHIDYLYRSTAGQHNPVFPKAPFSPRIEKLGLRGVAVDWIPRLSNLTFLELRGVGKYTPSVQVLFGILQSSPRLEHLSLDLVATYSSNVEQTALSSVSLPLLRILYLEERERNIFNFLPLLSFPQNTCIILDFNQGGSRMSPGDTESTRIVIQNDIVKLLRPAELESYSSPGSARLRVEEGQSPSSYLSRLSTVFNLDRFTTLEINKSILSFLPTSFIVHFFSRFNFVQTLRVGPNDQEPSHYAPPRVLAPGRYAPPTSTPPGGPDASVDPDGSKTILALAQARHQNLRMPLLLLDIRTPIPSEAVRDLETIVSRVVASSSV